MIRALQEARSAWRGVARSRSPSGSRAELGDVLDVAAPFVEGVDLALVGVEADHLVARLREGDGEGETYVSESYDSDLHGLAV